MNSQKIKQAEHGLVLAHSGCDRIQTAEALATVRHFGLKSQHYGWPGITRTAEGDLLVSASERLRHIDPFGREVVVRSGDNGRTWSKPEVIFDSQTDDRDCALCTLPDGMVIASWFSSDAWTVMKEDWQRELWGPLLERIEPDTLRALARGWLRRSLDGGRTWENRIFPTPVGHHAGPNVTADGDLIQCGTLGREKDVRYVCARSSDAGVTWRIVGEIDSGREKNYDEKAGRWRCRFNESHCLEVSPGHILCALRTNADPRNVFIARSRDGGGTWEEPEDLGIYGFPSKLTQLSDGRILCVFGDRGEPRAIRAILSGDGGETWDTGEVLTIREFEYAGDMGYPSVVEISPGELFCIYYYVPHPGSPAFEHFPPEEAGILSTRFLLG